MVLAIGAPVAVAYFIYRSDRWEPEGRIPVLSCWLLGMGGCYLALQLEDVLISFLSVYPGWSWKVTVVLIGSALIEEGLKFLILWLYPYQRAFFNEPMDGIVYAVMIAMGFAALENAWYAMYEDLSVTIWRSLTAVPAHAVFAIFQGYYAGRARFEPKRRGRLLALALLTAALLHGGYNFLVGQAAYRWLLLLAAPLIALTIWLASDLLRRHQEDSPFRPD